LNVKAQKSNGLKKWEYPERSGIWIREFIYTKKYNGEQRACTTYQVTVPGDVLGKRYQRQRKQFSSKKDGGDAEVGVFIGSRLRKPVTGKSYTAVGGTRCLVAVAAVKSCLFPV